MHTVRAHAMPACNLKSSASASARLLGTPQITPPLLLPSSLLTFPPSSSLRRAGEGGRAAADPAHRQVQECGRPAVTQGYVGGQPGDAVRSARRLLRILDRSGGGGKRWALKRGRGQCKSEGTGRRERGRFQSEARGGRGRGIVPGAAETDKARGVEVKREGNMGCGRVIGMETVMK